MSASDAPLAIDLDLDTAIAEQDLRDRVHDQRALEHELGTEYHKNRTGPCPPVPKDPRFWCAVHKRPTTYKEALWEGDGPCCSWCRDSSLMVPKPKQTFDEAAQDKKAAGKAKRASPKYTSWD